MPDSVPSFNAAMAGFWKVVEWALFFDTHFTLYVAGHIVLLVFLFLKFKWKVRELRRDLHFTKIPKYHIIDHLQWVVITVAHLTLYVNLRYRFLEAIAAAIKWW